MTIVKILVPESKSAVASGTGSGPVVFSPSVMRRIERPGPVGETTSSAASALFSAVPMPVRPDEVTPFNALVNVEREAALSACMETRSVVEPLNVVTATWNPSSRAAVAKRSSASSINVRRL